MTPQPITQGELGAHLARLEEAGAALRAMPLPERIAAIDRVAARWRHPSSRWRARARESLARTTGLAPAAISYALEHLWSAITARELTAVAAREIGADAGAPERLAFHSLAGNVPGVGVFGMIAALLAGVPSIVKTARREPALPLLVAASLAEEDRRLGEALAVAHWPGGSDAHEALAVAGSSVVLAYGRDDTLDRLAARAAARLLRFGPRLSIALVCRDAADDRTAAAAARQAALYDQQGCLSPQYLVLEETDGDATTAFVDALATAFRHLERDLPRAPLTLDEVTETWRFLERERWRAQEGAAVRVVAGAGFGIVCDRSGTPPASPLNRHLVVLPVPSPAAAEPLLGHLIGLVEAVGVTAPSNRRAEAAAFAAALGAHRLCPLERMQAPPFGWRQSGHPRLASFLVPPARAARPHLATADGTDAAPRTSASPAAAPPAFEPVHDAEIAAAPVLSS